MPSVDAKPADQVRRRYTAGDRFGQYEIRGHLDEGGMAEVYEAEHTVLRKRVALKVLSAKCTDNGVLRERFLREGERATRIRHPNVVDITDVGTVGETPYLVMELLEGETLGDRLDREGKLPLEEAVRLLIPILSGVHAAHQEGIVHRDLKPENIFLARDGAQRIRPKILDFGVARVMDDPAERLTIPNAVLGTPYYMSPEQARGDVCDGASDQYALAVVLYETISGELPRAGTSLLQALNEAASGSVIPPSRHIENLPPELERVLLKALSADIVDRYPDVRAFALALLPFAGERAREYWLQELSDDGVESEPTYDDAPCISGERSRRPAAVSTPRSDAPTTPSDTSHDHATPVVSTAPQTLRRRVWLLVAAMLLAGAAVVGWLFARAPRSEVPTSSTETAETYAVHLMVTPADALITLDGRVVGRGTHSQLLPKDGVEHRVVFRAEGYEPRTLTFKDVPPPAQTVRLTPLPPSASTATTVTSASAPSPPRLPRHSPRPAPAAAPPPPATKAKPWTAPKQSDNKDPWAQD